VTITDDQLEAAYWHFDALHKGYEVTRRSVGLGPMSERDAFKAAVRILLSGHSLEALPRDTTIDLRCPSCGASGSLKLEATSGGNLPYIACSKAQLSGCRR